jgi:DNA-binding transcriptional LysR family regulator
MRQLEESLNCHLLLRSSKGVVPTAAGMELIKRGREVLRAFDTLLMIGRDMAATPSGPVTIGLPASVGAMVSVPLVQAVLERYPSIELSLLESTSADLGVQLALGQLDIAVLFESNVVGTMQHEVVLEEDLFVVGLACDQDTFELTALHGLPLVMPARPNSIRMVLDRACTLNAITPRIVAEISSPHSMLQLARAGIGATVIPGSMLNEKKNSLLPTARIISPSLTRTICLAGNSCVPDSPRITAVRNLLRETLEKLVLSRRWSGARLKTSKN